MWAVRYHPAAQAEEGALPPSEQLAMTNVVMKLRTLGPMLPFPHQSAVRGTNLRELRPRSGRSAWRALYRRVGDVFVIGAISPEAQSDKRGFDRAVLVAGRRIDESVSEEKS
jgi:hypothetical protein